jgi:hypothetical protein
MTEPVYCPNNETFVGKASGRFTKIKKPEMKLHDAKEAYEANQI